MKKASKMKTIVKRFLLLNSIVFSLALLFVGCSTTEQNTGPKLYEIKLNLEEGKTYDLTTQILQTVEQSLMGMDMVMNQDISMLYHYTVDEVDENGLTQLTVTYDSFDMTMSIESPGVSPEEQKELNNLLLETLGDTSELIEGITFSLQVTPLGEIVSIDGMEAFKERLFAEFSNEEAQQIQELLNGIMSPEYFKQSWAQMFGYIPKQPVSIGDSWESKISLSQGLKMDVDTLFTLQSVSDDEFQIQMEGSIKSGGLNGGPLAQLEAEGFEFEMTMDGTQTGMLQVSPETGWIIAQQLSVDATADLAVSIEGQSLQVPIVLKIESTVN